jgi:hypothetical protein
VEQRNAGRIARVRFARSGTQAYPDATFTLRLSFGTVEGWRANGKQVGPFTTVGGLFERATGSDPFRLPPSWLDARARLDLAEHMNFTASDDIIGGNSGSPVVNRANEFVGIVFDGNLQSLPWDYQFDDRQGRALAVHSAGILDALRKIYHAEDVVKELTGK